MASRSFALGLSAIMFAGCGGCASEPRTEPAPAVEPAPAAAATTVIEGVVRLAEGAELARYPSNPMVIEGRPPLVEGCAPPRDEDRVPVRRDAEGRLENVLVAVTEFGDAPAREPVTHEITIRDCRLDPPIVAATRGDRLVIRNETDYPYLPALGEGITRALLRGQTRELELSRGAIQTLECTFAASCGRAEIITLFHPFHAVTDEHGHFRIEGVPAGRRVRVSAWHPLYREAFAQVEVSADGPVTTDLVISPAELPAAPPPQPPREGPAENDPDILF